MLNDKCPICGYPLAGGTCDNLCDVPEKPVDWCRMYATAIKQWSEDLAALRNQVLVLQSQLNKYESGDTIPCSRKFVEHKTLLTMELSEQVNVLLEAMEKVRDQCIIPVNTYHAASKIIGNIFGIANDTIKRISEEE